MIFNRYISLLQVLLGQPAPEEIYGLCASYLEQRLEERESTMESEAETPAQTPRPNNLEPQNSFERNIAEITRQSVHSVTFDDQESPAPRKKLLRREGTFSIYDSGKPLINQNGFMLSTLRDKYINRPGHDIHMY